MTLQSFSPSLLAPAVAECPRSFWRRLLDAVAASRQRHAEQYVADYMRRHQGESRDGRARERERRFLGR